MPASRKQVWLARGGIVAVVVLLLILVVSGVRVSVASEGGTTVYTPAPVLPLISGAFGIVVGVAAVVFWMQPGLFFRLVAVVLAGMAVFTLFNTPTGLNHRLVVTPDYLRLRIGSWYSPVDSELRFNSVAYVVVNGAKGGGYELRAATKDGGQIVIPMCDLLKKASPEVFRIAAQRGAVIVEGADGLQIPAALRQ